MLADPGSKPTSSSSSENKSRYFSGGGEGVTSNLGNQISNMEESKTGSKPVSAPYNSKTGFSKKCLQFGSSTAMQCQKYQEEEETEGIWYQGRTSTEAMIGPMLNTSLSLGILKIMCTLM